MKAIVLVFILALSVAAKEEDILKRYERVKRDGTKLTDTISSNDGVEENLKFLNTYKENEIKDQIADSTEKTESTLTTKKENKNKIGTKLTNIKNIVTHEDIEGHRSVLSEALLHQLHGPNEKVIFLSSDSEEDAKLDHIPTIIEPGHTHGQQVVLLPKTTEESIPTNYHLQQIGDKVTLFPTGDEEKIQKYHLLSQGLEAHHHHHHHHPQGKVLVLRKSQEDVLTNLHSHIHSPTQKVVLLPKTSDESLLSLHEHGGGHQKVYLLPKSHDESLISGLHSHGHLHPHTHDHSHAHSHQYLHSHPYLHSHHHHPHHHQKYVIIPKGYEDGAHLVHHSLGDHSHSVGAHSLGAHALELGSHALPHTHTLGSHHSATHSLAHSLHNNYHLHKHGDKLVLLPKVSDETVAAINQLNAQSRGLVIHPNYAEERHAKMHYLPSVFANNEVAYKSYGGGYTLPVSPNLLSNLNIEHGKVPVVVSTMLGLNHVGPHNLVSHLHKNLQLQLSKNVLPQLIKHVKLAEHQVDKSKHEIDLGAAIHHHFTIVKKVGVPYLKPFPVQYEQRIPYPYVQRVPVLVDRPYKVHVIKPYPVVNPYIKSSEIPVKYPLSYPSGFKSQVLLNVQKSPVIVSKPDQLSKSIIIQKSEPVLVKHE